ncbi:MAG TPA: hypothetical protein VK031_02480, partial [Tissierellaceae bacterium]|nr:hypothetical protein [Tissierellaceae bacterium]
MDYIKDLIYVNKTAISRTYASIKSHWPIIFTGIAYTLLNGVIYYILSLLLQGPLYLLSGIIMAIITSSFISNYLYLLLGIINYDRLTMQDFKDGFAHFLGKIYGVLFIGYLGSLLLSLVTPILGNKSFVLNMIVSISVFILLNALPE